MNTGEMDAVACAQSVARNEISPLELVEAAIDRIGQVNHTIHAVIHPRFEQAREDARAAQTGTARFRGVPILVKDLDGTLANAPWHGGMKVLKEIGWQETQDCTLFRLLQQAGFIIVGKTNTPELGTMTTTEPLAYGPTRNPYNLAHSSGGSSGGSAAAVAARMVPLAHAGDGGGSIRVPASECGLVGLKPSRARVSLGPGEGEAWAGMVCRHVVTRTVRDSAAVLDILAHPAPGDPYGPLTPAPVQGYEAACHTAPPRLRVGVMLQAPGNLYPVDDEVRAATERCALALQELGHNVDAAWPAALDSEVMMAYVPVIIRAWTAASLQIWGERIGRPITEADIEPLNWAYFKDGQTYSAVQYVRALERLHGWSREVAGWWQDYDLLVTPTVCELPPRLGAFRTSDDPLAPMEKGKVISAFVRPFNVTGQPAISIPWALSQSGLPVGVQLVARAGREDILLQVAAQLEARERWQTRRPPHCATSP